MNSPTGSKIIQLLSATLLTVMPVYQAEAAPGTLPPTPLFLSSLVEPNVYFTLDDSGSMDWGPIVRSDAGLGTTGPMEYTEPAKIFDEVEEVRKIYRRNRYATVNVTNKPIESSAEEVVELMIGRFKDGAHLR